MTVVARVYDALANETFSDQNYMMFVYDSRRKNVIEKFTFDNEFMTNTGEFQFQANLSTYTVFQGKDYNNNYQLI